MPIRINLLAEAQAAEEMRRKDPVKRAIVFSIAWVGLMAAVSLVVQSQVLSASRSAAGYADRIRAVTNEYSVVMKEAEQLKTVRLNMHGLERLAAERFLNGSLLNAMQKTTVPDVQLLRLRTDFSYTVTEPPKTKGDDKKAAKPATAAERVSLVIEARDISSNPGDQVGKFKDALAQSPHLQSLIGTNKEVRLVNLSPPITLPGSGRSAVQFTLKSELPETVRYDIASPVRYADAKAVASPARKSSGVTAKLD